MWNMIISQFCCVTHWMSLTRMTFSMSFDGHQWNIPVESYFFMFSSIVSIWSCPGTNNGSCLKSTNHKNMDKLERPNSCFTSNNSKIDDFINQTCAGNELDAGELLQDVIESRSAGSQGRLIGPLEEGFSILSESDSVSRSCCYDCIFNH